MSCRAKSYEKFFFLQTFCPYASGFCAGFIDNPFKKTYNIILEYFSRKHPKCGTEAAYLTCIIFRRGERTALPCKEVMEEKNMKKSIAWILTVIMMLALLTGCGSKSAKSDTEYVKKNGKLIVGITDYEPMDYKDENGEWTGFDAEFARMFAKELGVDCEFFVIADWGQKFFELDSKNIDAIWNGMTITTAAQESMECTNAYCNNAQVVVTK